MSQPLLTTHGWRSLLFVPVSRPEYVERAHLRGADGILLDLEDGVARAEKAMARSALPGAVDLLHSRGCDVVVRINAPWRLAVRDLEAAVRPGLSAVTVPKASSGDHLRAVDHLVSELEAEQGMAMGTVALIAVVEDPRSLLRIEEIADSTPRLAGMALGAEDFATETGTDPTGPLVRGAKETLVLAATAFGLHPYGLVGSIAEFGDLALFRTYAELARDVGYLGSFAVHPAQVPVLNDVFTPSAEAVAHARAVCEAFDSATASGRGAVSLDGRMIDEPVARRARRLLSRPGADEV
jgi:citrate lyase subunit beta/citryl-CoA lyase